MKKRKVVVEIYRLSADKKQRDVLLTLENLSVRFKITKYRGTVFSQGTISVCGLSQEHINQLTTFQGAYLAAQNDKYIRLTAGYVEETDDESAVIFDGLIFKAIPTMPPDIWLNMEVFSNLDLVSEEKEISIENTTSKNLVKKIASEFSVPVVLDYSTSNKRIDKFYFKGNLPSLERKLYEMFKNDKIFYYEQGKIIVDDWSKTKRPSVPYLINVENGMVFMPKPTTYGCDVSIFLNPFFQMSQIAQIESTQIPSLNGDYTVYMLTHEGTSRDVPFYTHLSCMRIPSNV